VVDTINTI